MTNHKFLKLDKRVVVTKLLIGLAFVIGALWTVLEVDPEKAYRGGRVVLGDDGVMLVRFVLICCASFFAYWLVILSRNLGQGWLLGISADGLEVYRYRKTDSIPWDAITSLEIKSWKRKNKVVVVEVYTLIICVNDGSRVKVSLYGSGLSVCDVESALTKFYKPASELLG